MNTPGRTHVAKFMFQGGAGLLQPRDLWDEMAGDRGARLRRAR